MAQGGVPPLPEVFVISRGDCALLIRHLPDADAAYRPGVDIHGRAVAPADLSPGIAVPQEIGVDITVRLGGRFGGPANRGRHLAEAFVGRATVHEDGRAYFNGQPLHDPWQQALAAHCGEVLNGRR